MSTPLRRGGIAHHQQQPTQHRHSRRVWICNVERRPRVIAGRRSMRRHGQSMMVVSARCLAAGAAAAARSGSASRSSLPPSSAHPVLPLSLAGGDERAHPRGQVQHGKHLEHQDLRVRYLLVPAAGGGSGCFLCVASVRSSKDSSRAMMPACCHPGRARSSTARPAAVRPFFARDPPQGVAPSSRPSASLLLSLPAASATQLRLPGVRVPPGDAAALPLPLGAQPERDALPARAAHRQPGENCCLSRRRRFIRRLW